MIKMHRNIALTGVCIILGIMISWQYKSLTSNKTAAMYENKKADELRDDLIAMSSNNENLRKKLNEIQEKQRKYEDIKGGSDSVVKSLQNDLREAKIIAGLTSVKGKGVIIKISNMSNSNIKDNHLLELLNELRAAGAQAFCVNEERIVATSEVRSAGGYIVINGRQMKPPFILKAISDPDKIESALTMVGGQIEYLKYYGVNVSIEKVDTVEIPQIRDDGTILKYNLLTPTEN